MKLALFLAGRAGANSQELRVAAQRADGSRADPLDRGVEELATADTSRGRGGVITTYYPASI